MLRLVELGLFDDADSLLAAAPARTLELVAAEAELRFRQYRFDEARERVDAILAQQPSHRAARLLAIRLGIQAWQLDWAAEQARAMLARGRRDAGAALLLARVHLLQRDFEGALEWAERVRQWRPGNAGALVLEADVRFWQEEPAEAAEAIRRALSIDPLDPGARYLYGYSLWRRGDPALLPAMAEQWRFGLELDPLHLQIHWHLGNGHTQLTYVDYAPVADSTVRAALAPVDSLVAAARLAEAIVHTRAVEAEFPGAVLPTLWRGSVWYLAAERPATVALDSALRAFRTILSVAPGFGPAHNGVAAVLQQRQIRALAAYDSLESAIALIPAPGSTEFYDVFPDAASYPGDRVARMVAQQLGPAAAYLPLLQRRGRQIFLPPLHRDLAAATGDPSFRTRATFDQRRWMDIRGLGGSRNAAAGIEYLERGSHLGRRVLLHEFVHLVHSNVLTEGQRRRVRELYLAALQAERTLDYHAASSEEEFLAQAFEAYASPAKAHPLNYQSTNTRDELRRKDPATFAFVEELVAELERSREGDPGALRSNRAEVYVGLAREARDSGRGPARWGEAAILLDSALIHDAAYLPAMVEYASLERERGRPARAEEWLRAAEGIDPMYTPVLAERAELVATDASVPGAQETRMMLLRRAAELEGDPMVRASYLRELWELHEALGRLPEAIALAVEYAERGPTLSRELRELREQAMAAAMRMRMKAGYSEEAIRYFRERLTAAPLDLSLRERYADALLLGGRASEARAVLEEGRELLRAAGAVDAGIQLRLAEMRLSEADTAAARELIDPLLRAHEPHRGSTQGRLARLLISLGESTEAQRQLAPLAAAREPAERAEFAFTRGWISDWRGDRELTERLYREAVSLDPYHLPARVALYRMLRDQGRMGEAGQVEESAAALELPLGPAFAAALAR